MSSSEKELPNITPDHETAYQDYVRRKVEQGLEDIRQGRLLEHDEVEKRMARWLFESPMKSRSEPEG